MLASSICDASKSALLSTATGVTPWLRGLMGLGSLPGLTSRATWIVGGAPVPKARLSTPTTLLPGTVILMRVMGSSALTPQKEPRDVQGAVVDRKSTRLNSSHLVISYAVFCLKKKKKTHDI